MQRIYQLRFFWKYAVILMVAPAFAESVGPPTDVDNSLDSADIALRTLTPHVAEYKVKISVLSGKMRTEVKVTENGYSAKSELRASGLARLFVRGDVVEHSTFMIQDGGVKPLHYESTDKISKKDKQMSFDFDWAENRVTGSVNSNPVTLILDGRVHDRVSIQYELMLDLLNGEAGSEYSMLDEDELKSLQISNVGNKKIKVPFGKFTAVGIQHRKQESSRITTLWCVEELNFLPVLIEQHRDGKLAVRAVLTQYQPT